MARNTVAVKVDTILGCQIVAEFKGNVQDFGNDYDRLLRCAWKDIRRHLKYGKPTETMAKVWTELQTWVAVFLEMTCVKGL